MKGIHPILLVSFMEGKQMGNQIISIIAVALCVMRVK